ncbi:MAG: GNAT family N-acetyltransferase [Elusimicrobia bacterium]|nr:GNAT family N-acetyltransferase [Elusimicrobiota bacterium]
MPTYRFIKKAGGKTLNQIISLYKNQGWWQRGDTPELAANIVKNSHCFLLALEQGRVIGMGRAISDRAGDAYIQDITVLRERRSRGTGSAIVRKIKSRLKADGIKWIGLIAQNNSRNFYRKLGFKVITRSHPMMLNSNHV